ncbi:phenylalanine--tRNA ligase subunit alpha [Candidatus Woesearchaeota archaeon]|nr:phenylalanine--tRNA ligase subunit alpha [Candidatus Woesearchaeota archaeon]
MDEDKLLASLHPLERQVLAVLNKASTPEEIERLTKLSEVEVMRALHWLKNKDLLTIEVKETDVIELDKNGSDALKNGLVEKRFIRTLTKPTKIQDLATTIKIDPAEINVCLGILRAKQAIILDKGIVTRTKQADEFLKNESLEERFLKKLPIQSTMMSDEDKSALESLKKRKQFVKVEAKKARTIQLSDLGKKVAGKKITDNFAERLTSEMLKQNAWKDKTFRRYDVALEVPKIFGGRRHFVNEAMLYIKRIWLDLGFEEMEGNMIQTNFWNLDALFVPQDHPARTMQDTFYLKNPREGTLPKELVKKVKAVHENGGDTGSKGWQYAWNEKVATENVLRTHMTVLSAQTLAKIKKEQLPKKFFSVGRVFRNETLDWSHLFEFHQVDGIVIDPNANFRHLKAYLKIFYQKMGFTDIRLRPAHFPYTEPSVEVDVYDPHHDEWLELGGAGIFRPEVVKPLLGEDIPVLAWGLGLERIISRYYKITDIRDLYRNDLKQIREMKAWML